MNAPEAEGASGAFTAAAAPAGGQAPGPGPDHDAYEVLRRRLGAAARELAARAQALEARRQEVFGAGGMRLEGSERIGTARAALPAGIAPVGPYLLFAANPAEVADVADVFQVHAVRKAGAAAAPAGLPGEPSPPGLLDDPGFVRDFRELYRYYRQTRVVDLRAHEGLLRVVFRTGPAASDVRVLGWRVGGDGGCAYEGAARTEPAEGDALTWFPAGREDYVEDRRPYIRLTAGNGQAVELASTGGRLTVRTGDSVHEEPVEDAVQALSDAEVAYAAAGPLVLLRVRPYREDAYRHFAVNTRTSGIERLDALGRACLRLPEEQGVVFPGGYVLASGGTRAFDLPPEAEAPEDGWEFERLVRSPGGEDLLYVFAAAGGRRLLLPYHLIRREAATPLHVQGWALYEDGTLLTLRPADGGEAGRVHTVQRRSTPYTADTYAALVAPGDGPLARIGNPDLVRAVGEALSLSRAAQEPAPTAAGHEALTAAADRLLDRHDWLDDPGAGGLTGPLTQVRDAARAVLAEYARVRELADQAAGAVAEAAEAAAGLGRRIRGEAAAGAEEWVRRLTELRRMRGRLLSLRDLRYADTARLDALEAGLAADMAEAGARAAAHFATEHAFDAHHTRIAELAAGAETISAAADAGPLAASLDEQARELAVVTETVAGLDIADATVRTRILEGANAVLGAVNRARALLEARRRELRSAESAAQFAAESALLDQAAAGALAGCDTPEACDEGLARLLARAEDLAARFAGDDERLAVLDTRREEIHQAFTARRQALADDRAARARRLADSAARVLDGIRRRAAAVSSPDDLNAYFAADPAVARYRAVADRLRALGDPAGAAALDAALAAAQRESARTLRDRLDLSGPDGTTFRLGRHTFPVGVRTFDLALVPHEGALAFTITGTDYLAPVTDPAFAATRPFWTRPLPSETPGLYRAEYLAVSLLDAALEPRADTGPEPADRLAALVRQAAAARTDEGYERGVHDHDATLVLAALCQLHARAGLLRYPAAERAAAQLLWTYGVPAAARTAWTVRARSLARARTAFGARAAAAGAALGALTGEVTAAAREFLTASAPAALAGDGGRPLDPALTAEYLLAELAGDRPGFAVSPGARELQGRLAEALGGTEGVPYKEFAGELDALGTDVRARWELAAAWLGSFGAAAGDVAEAAALLVCPAERYPVAAGVGTTVEGLLGSHPRITDGRLPVRLDDLLARVRRFEAEEVPAYRAYRRRRAELVAAERERLRLDAYRPRPLTGFVRGRLLDEVYLPLVGDSLAKQFGPAGGLLMLMSPPGYGKTSLVEWVAARLGLALVTVSGPALGSAVTSLDPDRAPDAAARREVEKIELALEMGTGVLLYLDDIQHTSPELLQKFIPLCDATRRIEGAARTYDLRGKRFAVCMAGNPYTESGRLFRVPDMLANRADVWNLGDVLANRADLFALSCLENALTANEVLAPLAGRDRADVELFVRLAEDDPAARAEHLRHPYPAAERAGILAVLRHLLRVRRTVLAVNAAYIASAAQADAARTEPPFLLQGSYRDMAALAARVVPAMTPAEVEDLVTDHYRAEAGALASGAEAALLKLAELRGTLTPERAARWAEVKAAYAAARS